MKTTKNCYLKLILCINKDNIKNVRNKPFNFSFILIAEFTALFSSFKLSNTANYTDWRGGKSERASRFDINTKRISCEQAKGTWSHQFSVRR